MMIQNGSLNELHFQTRTQIPNVNRIFNESQQIISLNYNRNHKAQSQNLNNRDANFSLEYKKKLMRLMVMVKFQRFGYQKNELLSIIQHTLDKISNLDKVDNRHLSDQAGKVFLKVFSSLIGQNFVQFRHQNNEEIISEEQRQDQMPQSQFIQRRSQQPERMIRIRPLQQNSILCNICYTISNNNCDQTCGHSFCVQCMTGYLKQNLRSDNYIVKCPEYECRQLVSLSTVKQMLSSKQYKRFIFFRQKNEKEMNPENKFCSVPDCGEVLQSQVNKLICPKCKAVYCQVCLHKYHEGQACDVALSNQLEHFKHFQIKKCPGCKSPIEKSDGCNHMTCKKCKYEFCWLCQNKYTKHHYRYYNCLGCPGMQYQSQEEILVQRLKQICLYMFLPIVLAFLLFCYLAGLPLYIIAKFIERPCYWSRQGLEMAEYGIALKMCCQKETLLFYILTWLLFQPRALLYALFISPVKLTLFFWSELGGVFE